MSRIALDCSAALALFLDDEQPPLALTLLDALPDSELWIPALWRYEFTNALLMAQRRRRLTPARAEQILQQAARLPLHLDAETPEPVALFVFAARHGLTAYDAAYLELARRRQLALATLDTQLIKAARDAGIAIFGSPPVRRGVREPKAPYRRQARARARS
jgi:predicted nucleic acid-binding protein